MSRATAGAVTYRSALDALQEQTGRSVDYAAEIDAAHLGARVAVIPWRYRPTSVM
ncbi:hypothetical protein [Streptomyces canus]|uniref:hypothetical protein n=1 Tax=Streptomyces canus TaxID=58343 RepID=UPI0033AC8626